MKKIFTFLTLALISIGTAWATDEVVVYYGGTQANSITVNDFTLTISGNTAKKWTNGNGTIAYGGQEYQTLKNSNGAQNTITCPTGRTATKIVFYAVANADAAGVLSEIDGESCEDAVSSLKDYKNPTVIEKDIANKNSFTFTFSTKQVCFIAVVTLADSTEPQISFSPKSIDLDLTPLTLEKSAKFTVTGKNLPDGTYDLIIPTVEGMTVAPTSFTVTDGAVSQEFTVTYTSAVDVEAASAIISAEISQEVHADIAVNYSCRSTAYTQTTVSEATTWNWEKLTAEVELSDATTPTNKETFVFANIEGVKGLAFNNDFTLEQARQIKMINTQFPSRNKKFQNGTISFTTTVPGTVVVDFSDTGSSVSATATPRYLLINGMYTQYWTSRPTEGSTKSNDRKTTEAIAVPAGEVVISSTQAVCIYSIKFTPAKAPASVTAKITDAGFATFASQYAVTLPEGIEAYYASAAADGKVTLSKIEGNTLPAATPVVLKGNAGEHPLAVATSTEQLAATNLLKGTIGECTPADEAYYTLAAGPVFKKSSGGKLAAGKAYLVVPASEAPELTISFESEVTGISEVKGASQQSAAVYSISGQRVALPSKGLYIQNGKKVILK